ncbi:MAG TPA: pitrilysin family protein [Candidatus Angelobacter sp.]|jgi:zinc protease|nr:pitrilysin family protein [Candidatus Angelobacter sp.]
MKHVYRLLVPVLIATCLSLVSAQSSRSHAKSTRNTSSAGQITSWKQIPIPPLHPFNPQQPRRIELPNGMVIFLQEDHELPKIDGTIRIRGGGRDVPAGKLGMAGIYGGSWRTGGTKNKTGDELDDFLETRAARVETMAGIDSMFLFWSSLKGDFDQVWPVVVDLLQTPEFRQDKIDLAKRQIMSAISRRNDEISQITQRESNKLAYGPDSPYARTAEYPTVAAVTREDLLNWHKRTVAPNNVILGVTGDFDPLEMERRLRDAFANWPKGEQFQPVKTEFHDPVPGIYFVEKDDVNQSEISMVDLGIERRNPDYYAVEVMNELFGGGFSSRLFANIRTKQGLAYFVGGGVGAEFDHLGVTRISMGTKSSTTAAAIDALKKQINDLVQGGVKESEVKKAKDGILNSFIFEFDSKERVQDARMGYEFYGYPSDFLERFRAGVEKVTVADVERVARKYIHPEKLAVLVVGNSKDFDRPLSAFGKVTTIDITIPQAPK